MRSLSVVLVIVHILVYTQLILARHEHNYLAHHYQHYHQYQTHEPPTDLSIWISEQQVKVLSGYSLRIFAIENGRVSHFLRDPAFDSYLPMIPPEVSYVNFTWTAGQKKYRYHFDQMTSLNEEILQPPIISIKPKGKIPHEPKRNKLKIVWIIILLLFFFQNSVSCCPARILLPVSQSSVSACSLWKVEGSFCPALHSVLHLEKNVRIEVWILLLITLRIRKVVYWFPLIYFSKTEQILIHFMSFMQLNNLLNKWALM